MIGHNPNAAPENAPETACPTGIPNTAIPAASATANPISAAQCAFIRTTPSNTSTVASGNTATSAD